MLSFRKHGLTRIFTEKNGVIILENSGLRNANIIEYASHMNPWCTPRRIKNVSGIELYSKSKPSHHVYFLMLGRVIQYIGRTTNIHGRISIHASEKRFGEAIHFPVQAEDAASLEEALIKLFRPKMNRTKITELNSHDRTVLAVYNVDIGD